MRNRKLLLHVSVRVYYIQRTRRKKPPVGDGSTKDLQPLSDNFRFVI